MKRIKESEIYIKVENCYDESSDHTLVIITLSVMVIQCEPQLQLNNQRTDWEVFKEYLEEHTQHFQQNFAKGKIIHLR